MQLPKALPLVVAPVSGENLHGYVRRLCAANGIPNVALFRAMLGIGTLAPSTEEEAPWLSLAAGSLQTVACLETMAWRKQEGGLLLGLLNFHGHAIQKKFLRTSRLRICPHCIRATQIVRDTWSLFHMTACAEHSVRLVDACDSCYDGFGEATPLKLSSAAPPWHCHCGRYFGDFVADEATPHALLVTRALEKFLSEQLSCTTLNSLPAEIIQLPLNDFLTFIDVIGTAATTSAAEDLPHDSKSVSYRHGLIDQSIDLNECYRRADATGRLLANWPASYQELLAAIAFRNPDTQHHQVDRRAFATKIGSMVLYPRRSVAGVPLKILQDQVDEFCATRLATVRRRRNLATRDACARIVHRTANMSALARDLGMNPRSSVFQNAYRQVIANMNLNKGNIDRAELISRLRNAVADHVEWSTDSISGTAAAAILEGLGMERRLEGWDHEDLLQKIPVAIDCFGKRKGSYCRSEALALRDRFIALAEPAKPHSSLIRLPLAMRVALNPDYKKTNFLLDLIHKRIKMYKVGLAENVFDLFLDTREIRLFSINRDIETLKIKDSFLNLRSLNRLAERMDLEVTKLTSADMKILREKGLIRIVKETVFDGQRHHPSYKYNVRDFLRHAIKPSRRVR